MKKSSTTLEDLKEASNLFGTLKVPEVYYASKLPQTVEKILQESLKKSNVGELPAILDEASRNKNIRLAQKMRKSIISLCETATELATTDARKSAKSLKIASGHLDKLNKLDKQYEAAQKKQSKAINASKNKKFLLDAISRITKARNESVLRWNQAQKDIQSARG